ncbi:uncharacterized protein PFL1_02959 [Pseudozyma flocculosa PF-1]|nr:uncharacterized protein PFL1_02959 [Pseudozyma flocculosa PF-1]EPQ29739.1 hypothetical protein PFL1_02959 [Pseudozyma flocculosa PF-1]
MGASSQHGTPVYLTIWDLSPPSLLSSSAYRLLGLGAFHTNLWLPDLAVEYAYGGHAHPGVSGAFAIPRDPLDLDALVDAKPPGRRRRQENGRNAPRPPSTLDGISWWGPEAVPCPGQSPIPGARYMGAWFVGYAGPPPPSRPTADHDLHDDDDNDDDQRSEFVRWAAPQSGARAFKEPLQFSDPFFLASTDAAPPPPSPLSSSAAVAAGRHPRHGGARLKSVNHALATLQAMRQDATWCGTRYDLLARNCNHFTDAACRLLVGTGIPGWINRSANLGRSVVWAVPKSLLDIETGILLDDDAERAEVEDDRGHDQDCDHGRAVDGTGARRNVAAAAVGQAPHE